jgi:hypothetical protein
MVVKRERGSLGKKETTACQSVEIFIIPVFWLTTVSYSAWLPTL